MKIKSRFTHAVIALALIVSLLGGAGLVYASSTPKVTAGGSSAFTVGETVELSLTVTNTSSTETAENVTVSETTIFDYVELVADSVKVDGVSVSYTYSSGSAKGLVISLGDIPAGKFLVVTYEVLAIVSGNFARSGHINRVPVWGSNMVTVHAPTEYTLTVETTLGGTVDDTVNGSYAAGETVTITATPNSGFNFASWISDNGGSFTDNTSAATTFTMPAGNVTVTARFGIIIPNPAPTPANYSVTYDPNGGDGTAYNATEYVGTAQTVLANTDSNLGFNRTGYAFLGWSTDATALSADYTGGETIGSNAADDEEITLYAVWSELQFNIDYYVIYYPNGGTGNPYEDSGLEENDTYTVKAPADMGISRTDYTFDGWNTKSDGSGTAYDQGDVLTITSSVLLYAQWTAEPDEYNVGYVFESDDGTALPTEVLAQLPSDSNTYEDDDTVTALNPGQTTITTDDGIWTFTGWDAVSKIVSGADVTFKGTWTFAPKNVPDPTCAVNYDANGGEGSHTDADLATGSNYTIKGQSDTGITHAGYICLVWNTEADGSGTDYEPGDTITMTDNVTLYAQWTAESVPDPSYTANYDANGGEGSHTDADLATGSNYTIKGQSDTGITHAGYICLVWNTEADGSGTDYEPGDTITMTDNVTLYAQWEQLLNTEDHFAYICGYHDGSVRIDNDITRAEAASIFYRLLNRQDTASGNWFSDVPDGKWYTTQINYLASIGILSGYPDGTFRPDVPITRAEFAALASKFDSLSDTGSNVFKDVPNDHWGVGFINSAYAKGWVTGNPDGTFQPDNNITRAGVVSIVNKMLSREIDPDSLEEVENPYNDINSEHWAYPNVIEASFGHEYSRNGDNTEVWDDFRWQ